MTPTGCLTGTCSIPMYGSRTDWVKNALAAKEARLRIDGHEIELQASRMVRKDDIWPMLPDGYRLLPSPSAW